MVYYSPLVFKIDQTSYREARGVIVGYGTALQAGRSWVRFPVESLEFFVDVILPEALRHRGRHTF